MAARGVFFPRFLSLSTRSLATAAAPAKASKGGGAKQPPTGAKVGAPGAGAAPAANAKQGKKAQAVSSSASSSASVKAAPSPTLVLGDPMDTLLGFNKEWLDKHGSQEQVTLKMPELETMSNTEWLMSGAAEDILRMARHDLVYKHVFGGREFRPKCKMVVKFGTHTVHRGNVLPLEELPMEKPTVQLGCAEGKKYSFILVNADGALDSSNRSLVHWLVSDIQGDFSTGVERVPYLPPQPYPGTGYHRFVCVLAEQGTKDQPLVMGPALPDIPLSERYADLSSLPPRAPVGLAFFHTARTTQ